LFSNYLFNGKIIHRDDNINNIILSSFGLKNYVFINISQRLELSSVKTVRGLKRSELEVFSKYIYSIVPYKSNVFRRKSFNIFMLDVLSTYRGWRHFKGLPVRGQRTWSNAWSSYRSNNILRDFKLKKSRRFYGNVPVREANVAYSAEQINVLWKVQWEKEWLLAKYSRLRFKGHPSTMKIDLYSMANNQVMHPLKLKNLSKKQKQSFKKNYFSLGFEPGFTKTLLKNMFHVSDGSDVSDLSGTKLILRDERLNRKNKSKKKIEKTKPIAKAEKKKKKSVWD
jgi:ribosomal protein S13